MIRRLSVLLLSAAAAAAAAPLSAQTPGVAQSRGGARGGPEELSSEIPAVADSMKRPVPGTRVRIAPPPGWVPTTRFAGWQDTRSTAAIMVTEVPGSFAEGVRAMSSQNLAQGGMEVRARTHLRLAGYPAALALVRQSAGGMRAEKQLLAFGDDSVTVLIMATYPDTSVARLREPIRRALLSADRGGTGPVERVLVELPFEVTDAPGLKRVGRIANSFVYTESGVFPARTPGEAAATVGVSLQPAEGDLAAFSRDRLRRMQFLADFSVRSGTPVEIGGRAGHELFADARDTRDDVRMVVYQLVIPDGDGYTYLQAQVGANRAERVLPQLREMAHSLRPRPTAGR